MNGIFLALLLTAVVILDYFWDFLKEKSNNAQRLQKLRLVIAVYVLVIGWFQTGMQYRRDAQSDGDIDFVKAQLILANVSLANTTATVKGLSIGGDSYAKIPEPDHYCVVRSSRRWSVCADRSTPGRRERDGQSVHQQVCFRPGGHYHGSSEFRAVFYRVERKRQRLAEPDRKSVV